MGKTNRLDFAFNQLKLIVALLQIIFILSACERSLLPDEIEAPEVDDLITIQSYIVDDSPMAQASVTVSLDPFQRYDTLNNFISASEILGDNRFKVFFYKNGENLGRMTFKEDSRFNFYKELPPIRSGDMLRIEASHPDYGSVQAQQKVPSKVGLQQIEYLGIVGISGFRHPIDGYQPLHGIKITLNDPPGKRNFYQISMADFDFQLDSISRDSIRPINIFFLETDAVELISQSTLVVSLNSFAFNFSFYFSDKNFDGQSYSFILKTPNTITSDSRIIWRNISEAWFDYTTSIINQRLNSSFINVGALLDNYVQPSSVEGNVEGGLGCFCTGTEELYEID